MTSIEANKNDLVIRDVPVMQWVWAVLFVSLSGFAAYGFGIFRPGLDPIDYVFCLLPAGYGLYAIFKTCVTTTVIHKLTRLIVITRRGIVRNNYDKLTFDQIAAGAYVREMRRRGTYYLIRLPLVGDRHIDLTAERLLGRKKLLDITDQINECLRPPHGTRDFEPTILPEDHAF